MADAPSTITLGSMTEAQLRSIDEFNGDFTNRAGVPDTRVGLRTRANGVFARLLREVVVQVNEVFAGRMTVPGLASGTLAPQRQGDDRSVALMDLASITALGVPAPTYMWPLNGDINERANSPVTTYRLVASSAETYQLVNVRGFDGVAGARLFALGGTYGNKYYSNQSISGIGATMAVSFSFQRNVWQQINANIPLVAYRSYNNASEIGGYQMAFEIGLGNGSGSTSDAILYYRQNSTYHYAKVNTALVSLPAGREVHVTVTRTSSAVSFYVNGVLINTSAATSPASTGNDATMRMMVMSNEDATRYLDGYVRNVALWLGTQPTAANINAYYRKLAGFA